MDSLNIFEQHDSSATLDLTTFVSFDLETTGLDVKKDKIIQIAAIKFENGKIKSKFNHFVNPGKPIPDFITRLTGISDEDCSDKEDIAVILPKFYKFIGEFPLIAHNLNFDKKFIEKQFNEPLENVAFDTLQISRILLPHLKNHKLNTICKYFDLKADFHRADEDAQVTGHIFNKLLTLIDKCDLSVLSKIKSFSEKTNSNIRYLFTVSDTGREGELSIFDQSFEDHQLQEEAELYLPLEDISDEFSREEIDIENIAALFKGDSSFSKALPSYELREEQIEMSRAVSISFNQSQILLAEAGTGIGKSLAYLLPSILWAQKNNERVIVSTNTKNLQEQLFTKDIPILKRILKEPFEASLLKGRSNYVCLDKWNYVNENIETALSELEKEAILPLVYWMTITKSGDINENNGFHINHNWDLWNKLYADSNYCTGPKCKFFSKCYLMNARKKAAASHVVIINHALLFSDLVSDNSILGHYNNLIIDEAHNIEKTAITYFGSQFSIWTIKRLITNLFQNDSYSSGLLITLENLIKNTRNDTLTSIQNKIESLKPELGKLLDDTKIFFNSLTQQVRIYVKEIAGNRNNRDLKFRYYKNDKLQKLIETESIDYEIKLIPLKKDIDLLVSWLQELPENTFNNQEECKDQLTGVKNEIYDILVNLSYLYTADEDKTVFWIELPYKQETADIKLMAAPLNIAEKLKEHIYDTKNTVVMTSATLTVKNSFDYYQERLGLDNEMPDRYVTLQLGSPFDYKKQSSLLIPNFLKNPKDIKFNEESAQFLKEIISVYNKRTLILFTSYSHLNSVYRHLMKELNMQDRLILAQNISGNRSAVIDQFIGAKSAVLLGTNSFWEGVDLPGDHLELLCIVKLPFAVPSEPIFQAQLNEMEKKGKDPFRDYTVPEAVIKFKQGFGRLIRTKKDTGICILMDNRTVTTGYGRSFIESIPAPSYSCSDMEEVKAHLLKMN